MRYGSKRSDLLYFKNPLKDKDKKDKVTFPIVEDSPTT